MSWCISTVCTSNHYQFFLPTFIYSAKKAYPDAFVRIFLLGKPKDCIENYLKRLKGLRSINTGWEIITDAFEGFPINGYSANAFRFLLSKKNFVGYSDIYITDIDFIMFGHERSHLEYFRGKMRENGLPIACFGGAVRGHRHGFLGKHGWSGPYQRIAGGHVLLKNSEWFDKTDRYREGYFNIIKNGKKDPVDGRPTVSYREYDEVMLQRICSKSGIRLPPGPGRFFGGDQFNLVYRDIHLGDFKHAAGLNFNKMNRRIKDETVTKYRELSKDKGWQEARECASLADDIRKCFVLLDKHIKKR